MESRRPSLPTTHIILQSFSDCNIIFYAFPATSIHLRTMDVHRIQDHHALNSTESTDPFSKELPKVKEEAEPLADSNNQEAAAIETAGNLNDKTSEDHQPSEQQNHDDEPGSYAAARCACITSFLSVVKQCRSNNTKFTDPEFDILSDRKGEQNFLFGLGNPKRRKDNDDNAWSVWDDGRKFGVPGSVKWIGEVLEGAEFAKGAGRGNVAVLKREVEGEATKGGILWVVGRILEELLWTLLAFFLGLFLGQRLTKAASAAVCILVVPLRSTVTLLYRRYHSRHMQPEFSPSSIRQSENLGDCWLISAIGSLASHPTLLRKICIAWDQDIGVYGFLFNRDGEWKHTLVDDYIYLTNRDFRPDSVSSSRSPFEQRSKAYKAAHQTGSDAL